MAQTAALINSLKAEMRRQGRTYAQAAVVLNLSEASVKRLFAEYSVSLQRLDQLCEWLGIEISDLVSLMDHAQAKIDQLTEAQELELVSDLKLLLVAHCVLNRWTFQETIETYNISEHECIQLLARLDRMGVLQLLPYNHTKLMLSRNFHWLKNGPIQRFFERHVQAEFFQSRFDGAGEQRIFLSGMLSKRSNDLISQRIEKLKQEFNQLHRADEGLPLAHRFGTSLVLAMRPWEVGVFAQLRRTPNAKRFD